MQTGPIGKRLHFFETSLPGLIDEKDGLDHPGMARYAF
jgi:hypothetical protein